jgi:3-phenylpropionate/cinnamic acid dioxygenase small subunit
MAVTTSPIDQETHFRISQWLTAETALLDGRRFTDWLALLAEDFMYRIPVPVTRDNPELSPWADGAYLVEESRESLETLWAKRYEAEFFEYAWGENPPQRIRRFVTNVHITPGAADGEYLVNANVLLSFARQSDPIIYTPAARVDVIRDEGGELRLASRSVHLDQTIVTLTHMRLVF